MAYKQLITPNLDPMLYQDKELITDWMGWCLLYVQTAFKAPWAGSTAQEAWNHRLERKHADTAYPKGVYVPLWFSGYNNMGHVLIAKFNSNGSGKAWTSPRTPKASPDVVPFNSLSHLVQILRAGWSADTAYIGWSEDIGGIKVIEEEEMLTNINHLTSLYQKYLDRAPKPGDIKNYLGKVTYGEMIHKLDNSPEKAKAEKTMSIGRRAIMGNWEQQIDTMKGTGVKPVRLKPGVYEFK